MTLTELQFDQLKRRNTTNDSRRNFVNIHIKKILFALPVPAFNALARECLHRNHFHLLQEYLRYSDTAVSTELPKKVVKRAATLSRMYRASITVLLTQLSPDGYSPEIVEWLVINHYL